MRIGFDAKWFFKGPPSGKRATRHLLEHITTLSSDDDFFVFLDSRSKTEEFPIQKKRVYPIYIWGGNNLVSNLFVLPKIAGSLGLDVVLFQNFAPLSSSFARVTFIYDAIFYTNPELFSLAHRAYFWPMRILARKSHHICTISDAERRRLVRSGFSHQDRISVVPMAVSERFRPLDTFSPEQIATVKAKYSLPDIFVLYVGRIDPRKNLSNLVTAFAALRLDDVHLVLAGPGSKDEVARMIATIPSQKRRKVHHIGFVDEIDLPVVYAMAKVFVYISLDEGFGMPPLEAMAAGVPTVISNIPAISEICGNAGNYVDPNSPHEITAMTERLLSMSLLFNEKRAAGLDRSLLFRWSSSADLLYRALIRTAENTRRNV